MKKPLVLLVDDDRAVLGALETELRPAFEEIARIEAFDDPDAVIQALPGWTDEGRSIAVAIMDQRMPGLTGVELLVRLREEARAAAEGGAAFHPATHLCALLLTGYADLDAAIAAKNEAAVNRYVEKPWSDGALHESVYHAFRQWLAESGASAHYIFREVASEDEVREMLRMRFAVYAAANAVTRAVLPTTEVGLDADPYDSVSRLFGLMAYGHEGERMAGTLRVVGQSDGPARAVLERVVAVDPDLAARVGAPRRHPLPLMSYLEDRDAVQQLIDRLASAGERVVEPGRLTLDPVWRAGSGASERHLARHIIDGAVAFYFFFFGIENAILTCTPLHVGMYSGYGFGEADGTQAKFHRGLQSIVACLHGRIPWVPSPARERCEALAARIGRTGEACRCAAFPACVGGPYETGRFSETDLLCPALAREVVQNVRATTT